MCIELNLTELELTAEDRELTALLTLLLVS